MKCHIHAKLGLCFAITLSLSHTVVVAQSIEQQLQELRAESVRLMKRIEKLERLAAQQAAKKQTIPQAHVTPLHSGKGILELRSRNTTLSIGGRAKLSVIYNSASVGGGSNNGDVFLFPGAIPLDDSGEDGQLTFSARDTRLWFKTRTPTDYGNLNTLLEIDFWGASGNERVGNSHSPRLRHAYIEWGNFTMGQTFTTFMNVSAFPETNTLLAPNMIMVRQPLIRWTKPFKRGNFQIALEQPESTLTDTTGARITPDDDRLPDIASKLSLYGDWGQASLSGLLREIRSDGASVSDEAFGGAIHAGGRIKTFGRDNLRFGLSYGNALGRYVALNGFNAGSIDSQGRISLHTISNGHLAYQHWWNESLRSSFAYSQTQSDNDLSIVPVNKKLSSYHLNLLWSPLSAVTLGLEYIHAMRTLENGLEGELDRFHFAASYNF